MILVGKSLLNYSFKRLKFSGINILNPWLLSWAVQICYICDMSDIANIKYILTALKGELAERFQVSSLGLFGSVVRDDFNPVSSDIDIIVDFSRPIGIEFVDLADYLESKLSRPVDLVSKAGVKEKYFKEIETEIIYV